MPDSLLPHSSVSQGRSTPFILLFFVGTIAWKGVGAIAVTSGVGIRLARRP